MAPREKPTDRAAIRTLRDLATLGEDLRAARLMAGLTQTNVARHAGISRVQAGRLEHGLLRRFDAVTLTRAMAAVGLELRLRAFPSGTPIRDAGHVALLGRVRASIGPGWRWNLEVPVAGAGDARAWDAVASRPGLRVAFEAETRLYDVQAQLRRILAKLGEGGVHRLILVLADTHTNRRVVREVRELIRGDFPLDTRSVLAALRAGRDPGANGLTII